MDACKLCIIHAQHCGAARVACLVGSWLVWDQAGLSGTMPGLRTMWGLRAGGGKQVPQLLQGVLAGQAAQGCAHPLHTCQDGGGQVAVVHLQRGQGVEERQVQAGGIPADHVSLVWVRWTAAIVGTVARSMWPRVDLQPLGQQPDDLVEQPGIIALCKLT